MMGKYYPSISGLMLSLLVTNAQFALGVPRPPVDGTIVNEYPRLIDLSEYAAAYNVSEYRPYYNFTGSFRNRTYIYETNNGTHNGMADIFSQPISRAPPLAVFPRNGTHPVSRDNVLDDPSHPVGTNLFYTNLLIATQHEPTWTLPYFLRYVNEYGWLGMIVSHPSAEHVTLGPNPNADPVQYYINSPSHRYFVFGAKEFKNGTASITADSTEKLSVNLNIHEDRAKYGNESHKITFPLVQGMGLVTARYDNLVPTVRSAVIFREVTEYAETPRPGMQKFRIAMEGFTEWFLYAWADPGSPKLTIVPKSAGGIYLTAPGPYSGYMQVAKVPTDSKDIFSVIPKIEEDLIDSAAGAFPVAARLSGSVNGTVGSYGFTWAKQGTNKAGKLLMFALKHHMDSFDNATRAGATALKIRSPTKGMMTGIFGNSWNLVERDLPVDLKWLPNRDTMPPVVSQAVAQAASKELQANMSAATDLDSMYFAGKSIGKFSQIVMLAAMVGTMPELAAQGIRDIKEAVSRFTQNKQKHPLVYDTKWKGLISSSIWATGDPGVDFGNSHYNDHQFHYGYFILGAACIVRAENIMYGRSQFLEQNRDWVNSLVRDVANPSALDPYFPVSRAFDWYHGHSWAKGLFPSGDGKDEESSSEDYNFAWAMKMWGMVSGDAAMEARGTLMLGVMHRSINEYMYIMPSNTTHPAAFIGNRVTGILFENKVDCVTYFGMNPEYIHGIHMLPFTPVLPYMRSPEYVKLEWDSFFSDGRYLKADGGWKAVLMANYAIVDPQAAWDYFTTHYFGPPDLDNGASLSWYLAVIGNMLYAQV